MSRINNESPLIAQAQFIVNHLRLESRHLDAVIESSLEMQAILRERRTVEPLGTTLPTGPHSASPNAPDEPTDHARETQRNHRMAARLSVLRRKIAEQFVPVLDSRRKLGEVLKTISSDQDRAPTVTSLALMVDEPLRGELKTLRREIRSKLNQVQSISMGNQAVLIYTLDFYGRLLSGLTPDKTQSNYYDANGRSQSHFAGSLVRTNC